MMVLYHSVSKHNDPLYIDIYIQNAVLFRGMYRNIITFCTSIFNTNGDYFSGWSSIRLGNI